MKSMLWLSAAAAILICTLTAPAAASRGGEQGARSATAPDVDMAALWDGRSAVEFHSVTLPKMVKAQDARFLIDDEYVLGVTSHGESRAYPTRFVSWHHIVNDKIAKANGAGATYITVTYCIVCNSGMAFDTPLVNDKPVTFDFYGLYNGVMTMFDRQTQSVWLQVSGRAVKGAMRGETLTSRPLLDTTWGEWRRLHPDTLVMAPDPRFRDCYEPKGSIMARGYDSFPAAYFRKTVTRRDARLPMFEPMLAVSIPPAGESQAGQQSARPSFRAYPLKVFKGKTTVINEMVGSSPVAILFVADTQTACALQPVIDGRKLTLVARTTGNRSYAFYDRETGSRWNIEGRAEAGPLSGRQLPRFDSHMSQWYGWASYFPGTTVFGQAVPLLQAALK
ncbi:MAG TPA: DUF3179 domain-containing (seleno)protein [Chthonomonadaceae bacterium]|nr:DUF3179 domain-containing (seleno)protein [Chthonomonadaceae bacterium]